MSYADDWAKCRETDVVHGSGGGSSSYYQLPEGSTELDDLIMFKRMPWPIANIFKACYRWDSGKNKKEYEVDKIIWFANSIKKNLKRDWL